MDGINIKILLKSTKFFSAFVIYIHIILETMGLLDIDVKIDAVVNREYFENNGWMEYKNFVINVTEGYKPTVSWMKGIYIETKDWSGKASKTDMWFRYDDNSHTLFNLSTGERFTTDDVLTLEMLIGEWISKRTTI